MKNINKNMINRYKINNKYMINNYNNIKKKLKI